MTTLSARITENGYKVSTNRDELKRFVREIETLLNNDQNEGINIDIKAIKKNFSGITITIEIKGQDSLSKFEKAKDVLLDEWIYSLVNYSAKEAAAIFVREIPFYKEIEDDILDFIINHREKNTTTANNDTNWILNIAVA